MTKGGSNVWKTWKCVLVYIDVQPGKVRKNFDSRWRPALDRWCLMLASRLLVRQLFSYCSHMISYVPMLRLDELECLDSSVVKLRGKTTTFWDCGSCMWGKLRNTRLTSF